MYEVYQIIKLDAKARGLKHPTFWEFLASSSNNGGGLITYLIVRRNYPIKNMLEADTKEIAKRKK